jgi:hypothetical protein
VPGAIGSSHTPASGPYAGWQRGEGGTAVAEGTAVAIAGIAVTVADGTAAVALGVGETICGVAVAEGSA